MDIRFLSRQILLLSFLAMPALKEIGYKKVGKKYGESKVVSELKVTDEKKNEIKIAYIRSSKERAP